MLLRLAALIFHAAKRSVSDDVSSSLLDEEPSPRVSSLAEGPAAYIESLEECKEGLVLRGCCSR